LKIISEAYWSSGIFPDMFIVAEIISKLFKCVISHATVVIGYSLFEIRD